MTIVKNSDDTFTIVCDYVELLYLSGSCCTQNQSQSVEDNEDEIAQQLSDMWAEHADRLMPK